MSKQQWKTFATGKIKHHAFKHLTSQCETNRKPMHLKYSKLGQSTYCTALKPKYSKTPLIRTWEIKNQQGDFEALVPSG